MFNGQIYIKIKPFIEDGNFNRCALNCTFGISLAHLLVINLVEEKRAFHSLHTAENLARYSTGKHANTSFFKL